MPTTAFPMLGTRGSHVRAGEGRQRAAERPRGWGRQDRHYPPDPDGHGTPRPPNWLATTSPRPKILHWTPEQIDLATVEILARAGRH